VKNDEVEKSVRYLIEGMWLDLREFMFHVVGVHCADLLPRRRTKNLDNFDELIDS